MADADPAADLLVDRRYLMKRWEEGDDVTEELEALDAEIIKLRQKERGHE